MKRIIFIAIACFACITVSAQPAAKRKTQQQAAAAKSNAENMTARAQISFPTSEPMSEDVVWRRDIYRELSLMESENAGLYYPVEPNGTQMNFFSYVFKLMLTGKIPVYEYRLDGNEVFNESARVKPLTLLDNYHIYYTRDNGKLHFEDADIPSREVKSYYLKESAYYDQATSTFHKKVVALCPVMSREDDFGDGSANYPLFWVKYDDLAPFLAKQTIMTSDLNNAATMSLDDYFTLNMYKGKIYKTNNMLGQTLAQYCATDSDMVKEQRRIENELLAFEKNVYGDPAKRDSLDSIANAAKEAKAVKKAKKAKTGNSRGSKTASTETKASKKKSSSSAPSSSSAARVSVRRQRR